MKRPKRHLIDIEIDSLTNSIENTISGDSFPTEVLPLRDYDMAEITKKNGWQFNWRAESKISKRELFKLTVSGNPSVINKYFKP